MFGGYLKATSWNTSGFSLLWLNLAVCFGKLMYWFKDTNYPRKNFLCLRLFPWTYFPYGSDRVLSVIHGPAPPLTCAFFTAVSDGLEVRPKYKGILHCLTTIWKAEGLRGLYQGATPNVWGAGLSWGLYFFLWVDLGGRGFYVKRNLCFNVFRLLPFFTCVADESFNLFFLIWKGWKTK